MKRRGLCNRFYANHVFTIVANISKQILLLLPQICTLTGSLFAGQNGQINFLLQKEMALLYIRLCKHRNEYIIDVFVFLCFLCYYLLLKDFEYLRIL